MAKKRKVKRAAQPVTMKPAITLTQGENTIQGMSRSVDVGSQRLFGYGPNVMW